jgi:hypothetical protein
MFTQYVGNASNSGFHAGFIKGGKSYQDAGGKNGTSVKVMTIPVGNNVTYWKPADSQSQQTSSNSGVHPNAKAAARAILGL